MSAKKFQLFKPSKASRQLTKEVDALLREQAAAERAHEARAKRVAAIRKEAAKLSVEPVVTAKKRAAQDRRGAEERAEKRRRQREKEERKRQREEDAAAARKRAAREQLRAARAASLAQEDARKAAPASEAKEAAPEDQDDDDDEAAAPPPEEEDTQQYVAPADDGAAAPGFDDGDFLLADDNEDNVAAVAHAASKDDDDEALRCQPKPKPKAARKAPDAPSRRSPRGKKAAAAAAAAPAEAEEEDPSIAIVAGLVAAEEDDAPAAKPAAKPAKPAKAGELAVRDRVRVSEGKHAGRCGVVVDRNVAWTKVQLDGDAAIVSVRKSQVALVGAGDGAAPSAIAAQPLFRLRGGNWSAEEIAYGKCVLQLVEAGRLPGCADNVSRRECLEYALGRDRDCISHRPWYSSGREFRRVGPCSGAALGHLVELRDAFYQTLCPDERAALWAAADKGGATFVFKGAVELKAADKAEGDAAAKAKADAAAKAKAEAAAKEQTRLEKLLKRADRAAADAVADDAKHANRERRREEAEERRREAEERRREAERLRVLDRERRREEAEERRREAERVRVFRAYEEDWEPGALQTEEPAAEQRLLEKYAGLHFTDDETGLTYEIFHGNLEWFGGSWTVICEPTADGAAFESYVINSELRSMIADSDQPFGMKVEDPAWRNEWSRMASDDALQKAKREFGMYHPPDEPGEPDKPGFVLVEDERQVLGTGIGANGVPYARLSTFRQQGDDYVAAAEVVRESALQRVLEAIENLVPDHVFDRKSTEEELYRQLWGNPGVTRGPHKSSHAVFGKKGTFESHRYGAEEHPRRAQDAMSLLCGGLRSTYCLKPASKVFAATVPSNSRVLLTPKPPGEEVTTSGVTHSLHRDNHAYGGQAIPTLLTCVHIFYATLNDKTRKLELISEERAAELDLDRVSGVKFKVKHWDPVTGRGFMDKAAELVVRGGHGQCYAFDGVANAAFLHEVANAAEPYPDLLRITVPSFMFAHPR